jgi:hypothetical protein
MAYSGGFFTLEPAIPDIIDDRESRARLIKRELQGGGY